MTIYKGNTYDAERALYGIHDACVEDCVFDGPADGESALKECGGLKVRGCEFMLRYPLWHTDGAEISDCGMSEACRAALWYDNDVLLADCRLMGIKAMRECDRTELRGCTISSTEFGWFCRGIKIRGWELSGEYPFLQSCGMEVDGLHMNSKYSFQYVSDAVISNSVLNTKDAFWHSRNITVTDSVINGEYLGWYSENLRFVRCKISGTQPLCYAKGLVLEDCEMTGADFAFENSEVLARLNGGLISVKNPVSGFIEADSIGEIILDEHLREGSNCRITVKETV